MNASDIGVFYFLVPKGTIRFIGVPPYLALAPHLLLAPRETISQR